MSQPRFPVIEASQMTARQKEVSDAIAGGPRGGVRGPFLALIHHPDLAERVQQLGEHLRFGTTLSAALTEMAILMTARRWNAQYEWFAHERIARNTTDLPDHIIRAIQSGRIPDNMTPEQQAVFDFVLSAQKYGAPTDAAYDEALKLFGRQGILDLLCTTGYYTMIAMVLNTAKIPLPDGAATPLREAP